ncbi:MAG: hypothetical protein ACR2G4_05820, partial [Pyrinomonadaceae bacterium]
AFNALLKTLEEPPPRVVFIMATTESHKIPDTILSRSQQFEFRTIATARIAQRLRLIADAEQIKVADEALREIARAGEGSMRDAQSAFDQVISFSDAEITVADVETALGIAGAELRARVMRSVTEAAPKDALAVVDDLVMRGHDLRNFCRDLLSHVRDLLVVKVAGFAAEGVDASEGERRELSRAAGEFSESDLVRFFHSLTETERTLREGAHPRYQLEIGLVKLIEMRRLAPLGHLLERLGALEETLRAGKSSGANPGMTMPTTTTTGGAGGSSSGAARGSSSSGGGGGGMSGGGGRGGGMSPGSRASASQVGESIREASPPPPLPAATNLQANDSGQFNAHAKQVEAAVSSRAPANAASATDLPPWEEPTWDDSSDVAAPALKLVPPPAPDSDDHSATMPTPVSVPRASTDASPAITTFAAARGGVVEQIKTELEERRKPLLAIALESARKVSVEGDELYVEFAPESKHLRDNLSKPDGIKMLREVCASVFGREMGIRIVVKDKSEPDGDASGGGATPPDARDAEQEEKRRLRELAENHPSVQQVLRAFQAEIVDVRRVDNAK